MHGQRHPRHLEKGANSRRLRAIYRIRGRGIVPRPFLFLPLFTELPSRRVLGNSPRTLVSGIMLMVERVTTRRVRRVRKETRMLEDSREHLTS
jgi:hypothetical protein